MRMKQWFRCMVIAGLSLCVVPALAEAREREALFVVGQSATVHRGEELESALVIGGNLDVEGEVHGLALAVGGDVHVAPAAAVEGPAVSVGGKLAVEPTARIEGPRMQVAGGDFSQVVADLAAARESRQPPFWFGPSIRLVQVLAVFVLALFLVTWAPRQVRTVREAVVRQPARDSFVGLAIVLGVAPFCLLLAFSIVGIPLIPLVVLFVLATVVVGVTGIAAAIGQKLSTANDTDRLLATMSYGMLVLMVCAAVPFVGALLWFMAGVYGAGAVLSTRFGTLPPGSPPGTNEPLPTPPAEAPATAVR